MKTILFLRHAKSNWDDPALDDHDRPLNKRGYQEAPLVGSLLAEKNLMPDLIISSTALRAKDTAELVARAAKFEGKITLEPGLYGAEPQVYGQIIKNLPDKLNCVMLVGHNPDLEEIVHALCGEHLSIATATLVQVDLPLAHWSDYAELGHHGKKASLAGTWQAKQLR